MKIILLEEAAGLGKKGDILEVSDGHARNHLIPKGLALRATTGLEKKAEEMQKNRELKASQDLATAKEVAGRLDNTTLTISAPTNEEGGLYGSVGPAEIVSELERLHNVEIEASAVHLSNPMKELGRLQVQIHPHEEVKFAVIVEIVAASS